MGVLLTLPLLLLSTIRALCQISSSSDLNCNFKSQCRWRNGTSGVEDDGDFWLSESLLVEDHGRITSAMHPFGKTFSFTHAAFDGPQRSVLISDVVSCQLGGGSVKLWYYRTGDKTSLNVCVRQPPGNLNAALLQCFPCFTGVRARQWVLCSIQLPPVSQPFELVIAATFEQPRDVVAVDDITFDAILCESVTTGSAEGAGGIFDSIAEFSKVLESGENRWRESASELPQHPSKATVFNDFPRRDGRTELIKFERRNSERRTLSAKAYSANTSLKSRASLRAGCPATDCTFDEGHTCSYVSSALQSDGDLVLGLPAGTEVMEWILSRGPIANSLTGIANDSTGEGSFVYAGGTNEPSAVFVMSTEGSFTTAETSRLSFEAHIAGTHGRLRVCVHNLDHCVFERTGEQLNPNHRGWTSLHVDLQQGTHTILFVADQLRKNYVIGVDQIQLLNKYGTSSAECFL